MTDPSPASKPHPGNKTWLERLLGLVTEVHPGEAGTALLLTLNACLLLTAYYVIKPVREGLILALKSGAEYKSFMSGGIAVALIFLVPAYSAFASRVPRNRLVVGVTLFFVSHLVLFYWASTLPSLRGNLGLFFFLWVGVFNMMLVAQFWAFANDLYDEPTGKRLFPLIGIGATVGAPLGSQLTALLAERIGRYPLLLLSAALLTVCALLFHLVHLRESTRGEPEAQADAAASAPPKASKTEERIKKGWGFDLVFRHRYLRLLAMFSVTFTLVNTNGEYMLSKLFKGAASAAVEAGTAQNAGDYLTAAYGEFYFYVNVLVVLLQTFVVSRVVKYGGLKVAFLILPCIVLMGSLAFLVLPVLAVLRVAKTAENATDYSLNNTVRNMLWLPTTREMKYQAKQAVDTFFVRMGDVGSTMVVAVAGVALGLELRAFAMINVAIVAFWLMLALVIIRENKKLSEQQQQASSR